VRGLFMRALGAVYLVAFTSLAAQLKGLFGTRGIRPVGTYLDAVRERQPARERLRRVLTVFWLDASDETLSLACRAGQAASVLSMLGIAPRTTASATWMLYLSFVSVGREFLQYQWDALLLENGLHAILVAPSTRSDHPSASQVALMRWLAFRLQFESGHCKLASHDPTWRSGDACAIHFETQPLPTRTGWHAHQLPRPVRRFSTFATLVLELGAPWLAFGPRGMRRTGFVLLTGLQALIAATGNYGFFNVLTMIDNLWLLDDASLGRFARLGRTKPRSSRAPLWRRLAVALATVPIAAASLGIVLLRLFPRTRIPAAFERLYGAIAPLHSVNPYGLFAMMTTDRPEIVIEGSDDGVTWREYQFRYKAGDLHTAPRWAAPHQPRLDWQMWFAALGRAPAWFMRLLERMLEGSPDVLALLRDNPFPDRPPQYVRALLYDYRMTDRNTHRETGAWWRRELLGTYVPALALR
jgi:hypothetical protein